MSGVSGTAVSEDAASTVSGTDGLGAADAGFTGDSAYQQWQNNSEQQHAPGEASNGRQAYAAMPTTHEGNPVSKTLATAFESEVFLEATDEAKTYIEEAAANHALRTAAHLC